MTAILLFLVVHWSLSIFSQTFFLHRYGAHRMFTLTPFWERFFYLFTFVTQGTSFLVPRGYAILHREHHAFSDTERDPHAPGFFPNAAKMMWHTKHTYDNYAYRRAEPEPRFLNDLPEWPFIDRLSQSWPWRILVGASYVFFYIHFAPSWVWFLLLPVHFLMGPIHGAIVNWCGHKYGYSNFENGDKSRNTLIFDAVTMGELFQNNHHKYPMSVNFAVKWFEIDPCYQVMRVLNFLHVINMGTPEQLRLRGASPQMTP